ncbi:type IV pilus assembly protein PilM [Acetoanaerobium pronyense]|uniref:Type IV pilus assembly protein PilM n=1 Tax=Acetoanaerobium pronyense TaxID=1482736 RepID=A0ABS4KHX0_9FIRM|nr:pilus assembly protein PilM [Acetoanaerobium pronyense]MBP2027367.1 type IV pilus assembly protein PilM [Acetoanaerobium pronyense]
MLKKGSVEKNQVSKKSRGLRRKKGSEVLAIDLGNKKIKYALGHMDDDKVKVSKVFSIDTTMSTYECLKTSQLDILKQDISKGINENAIKTKDVICSIESKDVISRELVVPAVAESDLEGLISYEISQYLPIDISSFIIQYKVLRELVEEGINKYEVWVAVFPKDIASKIYTVLKEIGLEPMSLDIGSNIIDKLSSNGKEINNIRSLDKKSIAFVDMGYSYINVTILEEGIYRFNRMIDSGGFEIDKIIRDYQEVDDVESLKMELSQRSIFDFVRESDNMSSYINLEKETMEQSIGSQISNWADEIEKIIKYYTTRAMENKIDKVFIYGGSSLYKDMDKYMEDRLSLSTERIKSIDKIVFADKALEKEIPMYINAIGSIIRR